MTLSIIIVNYNVRELLLNCLNSIYKNAPPFEFEVFVVDNDSTDKSVEIVKERFPKVKITKNKENLGFPKANNQAIKISSGKYILLLNPDTVILNNAMEKMVNFIESNHHCGIVGPKLVTKSGALQRSCFTTLSLKSIFFESAYLSNLFPNNKYFSGHYYGSWDYNSIKKVEAVSGACMLIRWSLIDKIGFLDETLFCGEDNDLCLRTTKNNYDVMFFPFAKIIHIGQQSLKKNIYLKLTNEYLSKVKFFEKHYSRLKLIGLKLLFFTEICIKIIIRSIGTLIDKPQDRYIRLKAYFKVIRELG